MSDAKNVADNFGQPSYFIGENSGNNAASGGYSNVAVGYEAMQDISTQAYSTTGNLGCFPRQAAVSGNLKKQHS